MQALKGVDLQVPAGRTLALIGASGSGKSTIARCVTRLERPDAGKIVFDGTDIAKLSFRSLLPFRSRIQMIFQDPVTAMNPRFSAAEMIEEPLRLQGHSRSQRREVAESLMQSVALSPDCLQRRVTQFSGGQLQRLAIARALAVKPQILVLDEALSGLDLSIQAQVANLLLDLQESHGLSYLLISHDLKLVTRMAHCIAVMSEGAIVETGITQQVISDPQHAETRRLVAAMNTAEHKLATSAGAGR